MLNLPNLLSPAALIQIAFLFVILYWTLRYLETTVAGGFLRSIGLLSVIMVLVAIWLFDEFELETLSAIFNYFIIFAVVSLVIIFQPELRHGLTRLGRSPLARLLRRMGVSPEQEGHTLSGEVLKAAERVHLVRALELCGGHRSQTAKLLGISRKVLWEKMRDHDIEAPDK